MNRSTPGLPVHHQLPEFTQTHVHRVSDAIQPSHLLSSPFPPAPNPSQHQSLFQWDNTDYFPTLQVQYNYIHCISLHFSLFCQRFACHSLSTMVVERIFCLFSQIERYFLRILTPNYTSPFKRLLKCLDICFQISHPKGFLWDPCKVNPSSSKPKEGR